MEIDVSDMSNENAARHENPTNVIKKKHGKSVKHFNDCLPLRCTTLINQAT